MKFKKKPVIIEANQFDGTYECMQQLNKIFPNMITLATNYHKERNEVGYWKINTLEGGHEVSKGDWIIKSVKGEYYPCKPDIFVMTYDPIEKPYEEKIEEGKMEAEEWMVKNGIPKVSNVNQDILGIVRIIPLSKVLTQFAEYHSSEHYSSKEGECKECENLRNQIKDMWVAMGNLCGAINSQ